MRQTRRHRRTRLIAGLILALVATGLPSTGAWAAPTPSPTPDETTSQAAKVAPAEETPEPSPSPSDETTTGSPKPTSDPSEKSDESPSAEPSDTPSASPSASESTGPRVRAGGVAPQAVPAPGANSTVITVRTGGNRTGVTGVTSVPGVVLGLYATATSTTALQTCTADADGDCNFTVNNTGVGGGNRGQQYWVKAISAPTSWRLNPQLRTGNGDGSASESTDYRFQTPQMIGGQTISSQTTANFMLGTGGENRVASGGIWQLSRVNPTLPSSCGLDVALVMDFSGSVGAGVTQLKGAADTLVNALQGTPSRMSLFSFSTVSPAVNASQNYPDLTPVSTAAQGTAFKARYATWTANGGTNWDRGLAVVANAADTPDITVIITDGSPTYYNSPAEGPGNFTRVREVENGIFSANALRTQGTRVIALGVGAGVDDTATGLNLAAISGPIRYNGSNSALADYYQTSSYAEAGTALRNLALGNCASSISVTKQIVPSGNTGENITGAVPAGAGWVFNGSTSTAGIGGLPATQTTTNNGTGTVNFPLTFPGGTTSAAVTLAETQQSGYTLVTQGGNNAVCTNLLTGAAVTVTNNGPTGFNINAPSTAAVSCTVYNRAPQPPASIVVNKRWVINGTTYANGQQPDTISAQLSLTGPNNAPASTQGWGVTREGYSVGNTATISETVTLPPLCTRGASTVVRDGTTTPVNPVPYSATLSAATNAFTVTNVVTCESRLTLAKEVQGGDAAPTAWNLEAVAPTGALAGPNGVSGSPGATNVSVTPGVTYQLRESGGPLEYAQIDNRTNLESNPLSTGSMTCIEIDANGNQVPGFSDGLNGGVQVPIGERVKCTAINQTATLRLVKEVINDNGGTAVPGDWTLQAAPTGTFPAGLPTITRPGAPLATAEYVNVRPGVAYSLSEFGPPGYQNTDLECQIVGPRGDTTSIRLQPLQSGTCFFVNDDQPAQLTLRKAVNNGTTGATAVPADWTLRAAGPVTVTGPGNSAAVTSQTVPAGSYSLAESGGPTGYAASNWSCTGGTLTGTSVTVTNGANVTCTITNTANPAHLTLVKVVDNGTTGATTPATAWTLTAAGPSTITGTTGSGTVTNATVPIGTFNLSETGPAGYTASNWVCTGAASSTATSVTVALGNSATCTITNTAIAPRLTLVKQVVNQAGGTALPTAWTLTGAGPVTITGTSGSGAVTSATIPVGTYALSESNGPPGYTASSWSCTGGTLAGSNVTLALGANATCTIINTDQPAQLTLVKVVDNGTTGATAVPANWTLTAAGPTTVTGPGNSASVTNQTVPAGSYTLSEAGGPAGYTPSGWSCTGGVLAAGQVTVPNGGNVTCTITNTAQPAHLTLVKQVVNQAGGTAVPIDWTLTAAGPATITGATGSGSVTDAVVPIGAYTLSETGPAGYTASAWSCVGATVSGSTVTVTVGGNVTCTIVNTDQPAQLTLVKVVDNGTTGATHAPSDWTLTASGAATVTGPGNSSSVTNQTVPAGNYTLSESGGPAGYTASSWSCTGGNLTGSSVVVPNGGNVTCTITNTAIAPQLTLIKTVQNLNGGTALPTEWTLTAAGAVTISGQTDSPAVTAAVVPVGDYALSESGGPDGYTASAWSCVGATASGSTVTLTPGATATCTITNTDQPAQLTLVKVVDNGTTGATSMPADWTLTASGTTTVTGPGNSASVTEQTVPAGNYALSESGGPAGYTASDWTCTGGTLSGSSVTVPNGGEVTCTITNTAVGPTLTLVKVVDNGTTGATTQATAWTLTAAGPSTISGATGTDPVTTATVPVGTFNLSEAGPDGYTASDWVCTGAAESTAGSVTLGLADAATCTITNTAIAPSLTLVKQVVNENGGTAAPTDWTLTAAGPQTISGATGTSAVTAAEVQVGDYDLSESGPTGYSASDWDCDTADLSGSTVTVPLDSDITCTITNTDLPAQLTLVKVVDAAGTGATETPADWTLTAAGTVTVTGPGNSSAVTDQTVPAGAYDLSETGPAGYTASTWDCGTATVSGSTVTVPNGGDVTCTVTNTAIAPQLTLVKVVDNGNTGATTAATAWTLTADGPSTISGATGSTQVTAAPVDVGTYDLSESTIAGYSASGWVCTGGSATTADSVTLAPGDAATCTITNTAIAPTLTLVKTVDNNYGGTAVATDWTLTGAGPVTISGTTGSAAVNGAVVQVGDYDLSESGGPTGYTAGDWDCGTADLTGSTVTVPLGANVTCTVVNSDQPAQLTLVKVVEANNSGTTRVPADWTLTATPQGITGQDPVSGNGDPTTAGGVNAVEVFAGTYLLDESGPAGFVDSLWECTGGVVTGDTVAVPNGGNVTCTITNTAVAPLLTLVKQLDDPDNLGTAVATDWTLSASGPSPISGATGSATVTAAAVEVGDYSLTESGPADYTASDWTCVAADQSPVEVSGATVTLAEGDNVTCTIVNTPVPPEWAISKSSDPVSGSTVEPGDEITYTVTLIRGDGVAPQNVVVNDDLSDVLNNATLVSGPTSSTGTASIAGTALTWTVPLLDNPTETITYTVRVNDGAWGVTLRNAATSPGSSPCVPADDGGDRAAARVVAPLAAVQDVPWQDGDCPTTTEHFTPAWELAKTSNPATGSTVNPGATITYTLTATNTSSQADLTGAVATDDLSDVLNNATLVSVGAGGTVSGATLTWAIPDLGPGESAMLTYVVRVNAGAYGVTIGNVATPGDGGTCPTACTTDHHTPDPPTPPLPQTGTDASLQGLLIGLGLTAAGGLVIAGARRRRKD